jgi:hypothetical protein
MFIKILKSMYDREGRKYMDFDMGGGDIRTVKIPWRYNRIMSVRIEGLRPLQDLRAGESCEVEMTRKIWNGQGYWILSAIKVV